ncbi:PIN domain-containing protein [Candidatus Desantisbacteria bacterium]|nr:PIN domain-containing protein [Candidatus Desantisbacteria bacterium]
MIISNPEDVFFLDTNILVYAADTSSPFHSPSKKLRDRGIKGNLAICISPQVLCEFFTVVTDPKKVTNPKTSEEALKEITKYIETDKFFKIFFTKESLKKTVELVEKYKIKKQEIFDIQIVATMLSNNITKIYTYNTEHFSKFKEIEVLTL